MNGANWVQPHELLGMVPETTVMQMPLEDEQTGRSRRIVSKGGDLERGATSRILKTCK